MEGDQKKNLEQFFACVVDLLNVEEERMRQALEVIGRLKQTILELMTEDAEKEWRIINAPTPLDPNDRALKWLLEKCLPEITRKHSSAKWELVKDKDGKIVGLRYSCQNQEVENDIIKPVTWAFNVAGHRPMAGQKG